jgi:hypothetical protein
MQTILLAGATLLCAFASLAAPGTDLNPKPTVPTAFFSTPFHWTSGPPVLRPTPVGGEGWLSVKDPSIVRHDGAWHLFFTLRGTKRSHAIGYLSCRDLAQAHTAPRHVLSCHAGYFCAPQVFFFTPHRQWYLICQASDEMWNPNYLPAFSCTRDLSKPDSWSPLKPLFGRQPAGVTAWLDFWVICDDARAHLFFTSLDGKMWRAETSLDHFPQGWSEPVVALEGDVFEASHTYRLRGLNQYLTLIEAQNGHGWRYYKAYRAQRLDGPWIPLAAERNEAFASLRNVSQEASRWTDAISHGELLRVAADERLEVDPVNLRFLIQGVLDANRKDKPYGQIPWSLGLLEAR